MVHRILAFIALALIICCNTVSAQSGDSFLVKGNIFGIIKTSTKTDTLALISANVYWINTDRGTVSNEDGSFQINSENISDRRLIFSYVGFEKDTINIPGENSTKLNIFLNEHLTGDEVTITAEQPPKLRISSVPINTETITQAGLEQLACCDLSESFENTASVDVEQTDAVSGSKRIKMLGLAGFYTQILVEKKPIMRGLISPFALEYIPGFWIESIDISKGTSSVQTGYESLTGQINVELKKPEREDTKTFNAYQSTVGKSEMVMTLGKDINPKLTTMFLGYGSHNNKKWDNNGDSFIDMPLVSTVNLMNRWKYTGNKIRSQFGVKYIHDERNAGQRGFDYDNPKVSDTVYGSHNLVDRYEFYAKSGMMLDEYGNSIGLILSGFKHNQKTFRGIKTYSGDEESFYSNLIVKYSPFNFQEFTAGLSYLYDRRDENYLGNSFLSSEKVPGVFLEYMNQVHDNMTFIAGFRYDDHNMFGPLYTPRFHLKYYGEKAEMRLSLGKGYRKPNIFMDNPSVLGSSRELVISEKLDAEEAWNAGIQLIRHFNFGETRPLSFIADFYRTEFQNQVVVDLDRNTSNVLLYNLDGESYSNSAQFELNTKLTRGLSAVAAYRINDVKTTFNGVLSEVPLNKKHKGLLVLSYTMPNEQWLFDLTTQFNGKSRLPNTRMNPQEYQADTFSPRYVMMFFQAKRRFEGFEVYAGIENLTGFMQDNPIIAWNDPFGQYFDSSLIWGPTMGRRFYFGLRIR